MAIDRDTIIDALLQGLRKPVNIVLTPADLRLSSRHRRLWPTIPARPRALIKEAGAEGAELSFLTSPAYDRRLDEAIQQMLDDVGLKVEIAVTLTSRRFCAAARARRGCRRSPLGVAGPAPARTPTA